MCEKDQDTLSDICECDCHEYNHLRHCECCLVCPYCTQKIKYYLYEDHINNGCYIKNIPVQRLTD
jgi:hypothetical protein